MNVHPLRNVRTAPQWASAISEAWNKTLNSVFETGDALIGAKDALKHGEWIKMVEGQLPFGMRTAQQLMAVAWDERLRNANHGSHLPSSWKTLYALTRLDNETIEKGFENGAIHPKLERKDIKFLPNLPHYEPKAKKETPSPSKSAPPVEGCVMFVRRTVFDAIKSMSLEERSTLFAELRAELADLEAKSAN